MLYILVRGIAARIAGARKRRSNTQDAPPWRGSHLPVGGNFAGAAWAWTTGDIYLDPVLKIEDAAFDLQTIAGKYIRSFELFGKSARIDLTQAYQMGEWTGLLNGAAARAERDGWSDTSLRLAVNLLGAPPLAGKEFAAYRAKSDHETIVGVGLVVQLPTGEYFGRQADQSGQQPFHLPPADRYRPQLRQVIAEGDLKKATVGTVKTAGTGTVNTVKATGSSHMKTTSGVLKDTGAAIKNTSEAASGQ